MADPWDLLAADERRAIASLQRLAKRWPQTLMLFSWSGMLCVMPNGFDREDDPDGAVIATIQGIPNDGGDP